MLCFKWRLASAYLKPNKNDEQNAKGGAPMNKDDILAASRKENKDRDLYNEEISISAGVISSLVALFLTTAFFILHALIKHENNWGLYAIVVSFGATNFIVRAVHLKRRRDIIFAVIYTLATVALTAVYICQLVATSPIL